MNYYLPILSFLILISCSSINEDKSEDSLLQPVENLKIPHNNLKELKKDTVYILAIGNSFSEDAVEEHLTEIAKADNKVYIIGNLYYGGADLEFHWNNCLNNNATYRYFRSDVFNTKGYMQNVTIKTALVDKKWDYVSLQQVSQLSGIKESFSPYIDNLSSYIKANSINKNVKIILHQTWAYSQNSTHPGFKNYDNNQINMFEKIIESYSYWENNSNISFRIPAGTAVQNARSILANYNLTRDGYHLDLRIARYLVALTWYEKISGRCVFKNKYQPINVTEKERDILQAMAHNAVAKPNEITSVY